MTWLEVVDTAIKIGLGALIAGLASLLLSRAQHQRELRKDQIQREFEILKEVAEQVERFTQATLRYWALAGDANRYKRLSKQMSEPRLTELNKSKDELFNIFHELTNSEAKLLLLGFKDAQTSLRTYGDMVVSFRRSANSDSDPLTDEQIEVWRSNILRTRERLFHELHACYQRLGP